MKEAMSLKYALPILVVTVIALFVIKFGDDILGIGLLMGVAIVAIIIGEGQIGVKKVVTPTLLQPMRNYIDYVTVCKRNEREALSIKEWANYVRVDEYT